MAVNVSNQVILSPVILIPPHLPFFWRGTRTATSTIQWSRMQQKLTILKFQTWYRNSPLDGPFHLLKPLFCEWRTQTPNDRRHSFLPQSLLHFNTFQADNVITPTTSAPSTEVGCCHLKYAPSENCHSQVVRSPTHNSAVRFNINNETKDTALKLGTLQQFIWQPGVAFLFLFFFLERPQ